MNNVVAFVVGIDRYDQHGWSLQGPCANAVAMTQWLLDTGAEPAHIFLFAGPHDPSLDTQLDTFARTGVVLCRTPTFAVLDRFWRAGLMQQQLPSDAKLFVYWSGHGFADADGHRVFICKDYLHPQLSNYVFNSSNVLRHLRSPDYQSLGEQIFIADVCATPANAANVTINADKRPPVAQAYATRQLAFYATVEGAYASGRNGFGVFTRTVLDALRQFKSWPTLAQCRDALLAAFSQSDQHTFRVTHLEGEAEISDRVFGRLPGGVDPLMESVVALLSGAGVPERTYRPHFLRTVSDLGMPAMASAQGLTGMVRELASQRDAVAPGQASYGLLQFLLRLQQESGLTAAIESWLTAHADEQASVIATLRQKLRDEAATKILIVEINNDDRDEITSYDLSVRTSNLDPLPDAHRYREVKDWTEFTTQLLADIEGLRREFGIEDFQVQFLVNPPLFDRPFHAITLASGLTLGEEHIVLVRHRDRVRSPQKTLNESWNRYTETLRSVDPRQLRLLPVASQASPTGVLPSQEGLCYTSFLMQQGCGVSRTSPEKQTLLRLLRSGVPYVYWLHSLPSPDAFEHIEVQFASWLKRAGTLDDLPALFTQQRTAGNGFASQATLLWDDPQFNPFRK